MNKKALSPVVASIILIVVVVAVSITVAAWFGTLTLDFLDSTEEIYVLGERDESRVYYSGDIRKEYFGEGKIGENELNITLIKTEYQSELYEIVFYEGEDFEQAVIERELKYLLTDYEVHFPIPKELEANKETVIQDYSIWFYDIIPNIGKVAFVIHGQVTAWYEGE